ncbi:MAG TPA: hypothetical protein VH914_00235 [Acidimicrobiia bacterium]|jgi:hypothetical protein|nr:hypothetical protein [Acidimicrobiia bacterium]
MTSLALMLAATKTLWDPTIIGILAPVSGVFLFCGSCYLLLATNLGARLGFLIAATALTGFMVLLSTLWLTTSTPLESPKGRTAAWKVKEVVKSTSDSKIGAIRALSETKPADTTDATTVRSFLDSAFVTVVPAFGVAKPNQPFARFAQAAQYLTDNPSQQLNTYITGGRDSWYVLHTPEYAAVNFCVAKVQTVPFGAKPPTPVCDPAQAKQVAILQYDFGSIRLPPVCYLFGSIILFLLSLLGLHWFEMDERERAKHAATLESTSTSTS